MLPAIARSLSMYTCIFISTYMMYLHIYACTYVTDMYTCMCLFEYVYDGCIDAQTDTSISSMQVPASLSSQELSQAAWRASGRGGEAIAATLAELQVES